MKDAVEPKARILNVGSINGDSVVTAKEFPSAGETVVGQEFATFPGGKGANQAVAAARLGAEVSLVGCVGNDALGDSMLSSLRNEGVTVDEVQRVDGVSTGAAVIIVDSHAQNRIIVVPGANHALRRDHVEQAVLRFGTNGLVLFQLETPLEIVETAAREAKQNGLLTILNPAPAPETPLSRSLLELVDYIIPNETEAYKLTGRNTPEEAARELRLMGARNVLITLGEKGVFAWCGDEPPMHVSPFKVEAVDSTAAGDAFVAGFTVEILRGSSLPEAIRFASAVGALATTKHGAQPSLPTRAEVEDFIRSNP